MPLIRKEPVGRKEAGEADLQQATVALRSGGAQERWDAARNLGSQPEAARVLGAALATENDWRVREAIFTSLSRLGTAESADAVIPYVRSDDSGLRTAALDALRGMIAAVRPRLLELLTDPDPDIRLLCCDLVRELPGAEATDLLCAVLERESEPNVCAAAVEVLAEIGLPAALPALEKCGARFPDQTFVTFAVRIALERISSQRPAC